MPPGAVHDGIPQCSGVWVEGELLPKDYQGCRRGAAVIAPTFTECEDGIQRLTTHEGRFVAMLGAPIQALPGGEDTGHIFSC